MAAMIATMNAPVATNRWNLALATKNTSSGPSSVASLNSGCGVVLSIVNGPSKSACRYPSRRAPGALLRMRTFRVTLPSSQERCLRRVSKDDLLNPCNRLGKITRGEGCEIVEALTDADEVYRQFMLFGQRHQDAAARGAIELGHHQSGNAGGAMKCLDLRQRVLSNRSIEHQQHGMRGGGVDLPDDTNHLVEFAHQLGLVLQSAGGIDQQHVELFLSRR